ncbi:MAG TPA: alanyl-tRNA editing protein [Rectinemataceae bacterium]|nr:alanyl-tRNA editing protein [Rectinemataceae bacterium]
MSDTIRLYYLEPGLTEAEATLVEVIQSRPHPLLVLDRSLFYPEGGGQPSDLGTIAGVPLSEVTEEGGRVLHRMGGDFEGRPGQRLRLVLDADRRRDHREQHSAQHLLSALLLRLYEAPTLSFHLGAEHSTIDIDLPSLGAEDVAEVERRIDEAIEDDYPVTTHLCPPEDVASFPLRKRPPEDESELRIVEIDGIDFSPCCGTHVGSTGELRAIKIVGVERYKGMTRLSFVAGRRAVRDYARVSRIAQAGAGAFGCALDELPEKARRSVERLKKLESSAGALIRERAALEARLAAAGEGGLSALTVLRFVDRDAQAAQESARAFAARGSLTIAISLPELTVSVAGPEYQSSVELGRVLKPLAEAQGGRGGGGRNSFRASFPGVEALDAFVEAARAELGRSP